jgi:hypothetical protein
VSIPQPSPPWYRPAVEPGVALDSGDSPLSPGGPGSFLNRGDTTGGQRQPHPGSRTGANHVLIRAGEAPAEPGLASAPGRAQLLLRTKKGTEGIIADRSVVLSGSKPFISQQQSPPSPFLSPSPFLRLYPGGGDQATVNATAKRRISPVASCRNEAEASMS